jgi:hypothetical protein
MAFGRNQELTAEDLKKAGLDPADLAEMKANGVKKADLDTFKTELSTSIAEQIKNSMQELETKLRPQPIKKEGEDQNNNNKDQQVDENADFYNSPTDYIKKQMNQGVAFTAIQTTKIRMDLAMDRARAMLKGFKNDTLRKEIEDEWAQYKPEHLAMQKDFDPDKLITKIHNMVMGNHMEEINTDTAKREGKFNMVMSGNGGGGGNHNVGGGDNSNKKPEDQLTPVELKQASRYNMTAQEWLDQKKSMEDEENKALAGDKA